MGIAVYITESIEPVKATHTFAAEGRETLQRLNLSKLISSTVG